MGAAKDDGVDIRIALHEGTDVPLYEIVSTRFVELPVLHKGDPHRAGLACDDDIGMELGHLQLIGLAVDGALGGYDAYVACVSDVTDSFDSGSDDTKDAACGVVHLRQVALLDCPECFGRCRVAGKDDQMATHLEEVGYGLTRKLIDHAERA